MALKIEKVDPEAFEKSRVTSLVLREEEPADYVSDAITILTSRWKLVAFVTFLAVAATYATTKLLLTRWYRATAIIEPITEGGVEDRMEGGMGSVSGSDVAALMGLGGGADQQAQEFMTILQSFAFSTAVVRDHHLTNHLLDKQSFFSLWSAKPATKRKIELAIYDELKDRFQVDYSIQAENLSLHFFDEDPIVAQSILGYYVADLRELLRQDAIRTTSAAIQSLEKEAKATGDPMLAQNLYALVAKQVQRQKLAEVEADFAFKILEPPISPDKPYWPRAILNCFIVMVLTPVILLAILLSFGGSRELKPSSVSKKYASQFADLA